MQYSKEQIEAIVINAEEAAHEAAQKYFKEQLHGRDGFPCGFAWVDTIGVKGNTKLGRALKALNFGQRMWCPSKLPVQNVYVHEAAASAAAEVLKAYGINAIAQSRWD